MYQLHFRHFPPRGFDAITLLNVIIVRGNEPLPPSLLRHERIHWEQEKELLIVGFYLLYAVEFIVRFVVALIGRKPRPWLSAYLSISFEREAYKANSLPDYLKHRRHYAWTGYLLKQ